ncbi:MAG TPA: STAS domain-containing protein [Pseudonocardiaceae bacterium]|nr:STAS domain-containing protein [Pseudonocardiaceae bacterium]
MTDGHDCGRELGLSAGPELVVDMRGLTFIDHRRLLVLAELARGGGHTLVVRSGVPGPVAPVVKMLGLGDVHVMVTQ